MKVLQTRIGELADVAIGLNGILTSLAARDAGIADSVISRLARRGRLERTARGVYRIPFLPPTRFSQYQEAVMWLRAHRGPENVALSHLTALAVFAISDANPSMIHLTVPRAARLRRAALPGVAIHRGNLAPDDVVIHEGLPVTSVARTVRDLLAAGGRIDLIRQAIADARREGFIGGAETRRLRRLVNKHLMALEAGAQPPPA